MILEITQVNEQYIYAYVGVSEEEINEYFANSIYKITSIEEYEQLSDSERIACSEYIKTIIQEDVQNAVMDRGYLVISDPLVTYRGSITYDNPLFVILKYCIVSEHMELVFPKTKMMFNRGELPREVLDEVIRTLLLKSGYFTVEEVEKYTSTEQIASVDFIINGRPIGLTFNPEDGNTLVDFRGLLGYNKGDELPLDIFDLPGASEAKLVTIYQKVPMQLTNDLVKQMHIPDVNTIEEFEKEINDTIHPNRQRMVLVDKIIDYIVRHSDIEISEMIISHFISLMAKETATTFEEVKADWDFYSKDIKDKLIYTLKTQMVRLYLIRFIQRGNLSYIDDYLINVQEQYDNHLLNLARLGKKVDEQGLFLREQLDYALLFNYFVEQEIIIL